MEDLEDSAQAQSRLSPPASLTAEHELSEFDCGEPALNDWLQQRALKNQSRFSRTYVVCKGKQVVAYYSILAGAVEHDATPSKIRRNAPQTIPVSIIGRLAVSRTHAGRGLGADILADALRRIAIASQSIGIGAVLVHAKDETAKRFYMRCAEFIEYPVDSRTMFLPIETVLAALS